MASPTATGDNYTTSEQFILGRHRHLGLMEYKDLDAYYCTDCGLLFNVRCANCGAVSEYKSHLSLDITKDIFYVERPLVTTKKHNLYWTVVECRKCDFHFKVIVR